MIRVNLARDRTQVSSASGRASSGFGISFGRSSGKSALGQGADLIVKFGMLFLPIGGLMFFEQTNITAKQSQISELSIELGQKQAELDKMKLEAEAVEKFKAEKKKLQTRLDTVKLLSKERLKIVKALETVQSAMPEKAWLTNVKISGDRVELQGNAVEEVEISNLMQALEDSVFFKTVMLQSAIQVKAPDGVVKSFKVTSMLENN